MQRKAFFVRFKPNSVISFLLILILLIGISRIVLTTQNRQEAGQQVAVNTITFTPSVIPPSYPEMANPWRGAYEWYDSEVVPDWPFVDSYVRYDWWQIEPAEGNYDFSLIDKELALAQ